MLPYELVGFYGTNKTKEARESKEKSCILWKFKFKIVPKLSHKSYELWNSFVDWLVEKQIEIIADFEHVIEIVYEMSSDSTYIKKRIGNTEVLFKANEIRYGQKTYAITHDSVEIEQKKIIAEMKPNGAVIIQGIFHVRNENRKEEWIPPFNEKIKKSIEGGKAVAVINASVKDGKMGGQIIVNTERRELVSNKLYHKNWIHNTSGSAEVMVLLELITLLEKKGRNIREGKIVIGIDYKRAYRKIEKDIRKSNEYAQESGAEIAMIKRLIKKIKFEVEIKLIRGHESNIDGYQ